ncbi:homeobox protein 2-like, partial [Contarinia nasturtii]|uniref:homeobox protein 2-like n=1 Tax=Contarinia nasturtii TaxID=265458 RepID=UPI0012D4BF5D
NPRLAPTYETETQIPRRVSRSYNNTPIFNENTPFNRNTQSANNRIPFREIPVREHSYRDASGARETYLKRLKNIPKFNGDSYSELKEFINKADTLYHYSSNEIEEDEFFEQMIFQLGEEPKNVIINLNNPDWVTIKQKLLKHYSYLSNKDLLASQIENLHQEKNESILKYSERARKLLRERNATYSNLSEDQRREHNKTALRAFARGLDDNRLKEKLSIRGSDTLENSIAYALEAESESFREIPQFELYCRYCRSNGHRERDCRRMNNGPNNINDLASILRSLNMSNQNNFRDNSRNNMRTPNAGYRFGNNRFSNFPNRQNFSRNNNYRNPFNYENRNNRNYESQNFRYNNNRLYDRGSPNNFNYNGNNRYNNNNNGYNNNGNA